MIDMEWGEGDKKILAVAILAFLLGIVSYSIASSLDQDIAFETIGNNTDLYLSGERTHNVTYYANGSEINLYLIFHSVGSGAAQNFDSNLSVNDTIIQDFDFRTSSGPGFHEHWSITARIPKGSSYKVTNSTNVETIEWREHQVLSGKNGTISLNQTFITQGGGGGGVSFDGSDVNVNGSKLWNFSIDHRNLTNLNGSNTGHAEFSNLVLNENIVSAGRVNITRDNRTAGTKYMLGTIDMMLLPSNGLPFLFYTVGRWYNTSNSTSGTFEYAWNSSVPGALIQVAGQQILFRTFGAGSLSVVNKFETNMNQTKIYCNSTKSGNFKFVADTDNNIYIYDCESGLEINKKIELYNNGSIQSDPLAGTGNCRLWSDNTGKIYRNTSDCG